MADDKLIEQIGKLLENNTAHLRSEMLEMKTALQSEMLEMKKELKETIIKSQEETIEAITDLVNGGYELHEKRLKKIEETLHIPHSQ